MNHVLVYESRTGVRSSRSKIENMYTRQEIIYYYLENPKLIWINLAENGVPIDNLSILLLISS